MPRRLVNGYPRRKNFPGNKTAMVAVDTTNKTMTAMQLVSPGSPLTQVTLERPRPGRGQVRVAVSACGVCRTDLHVIDGDLEDATLPLVPGHEIVGTVDAVGEGVRDLAVGERVGVPWLGYTCGHCGHCAGGHENLCDDAGFTGYTLPGGYAEYTVADARYCFPIAGALSDAETAPLLCAGLIGYRSYRMTGEAARLGIYGFGAAAHIIIQIALHQDREVFAFTRPGDESGQAFARRLGAVWAGDSTTPPPAPLDAAIIFAPVGSLVAAALAAVRKGGVVVCAGIHMSNIPAFPYALLWGERTVRSVANLTRADGVQFLDLAAAAGVRTEITRYPLRDANRAVEDLRQGRLHGAAVLEIG